MGMAASVGTDLCGDAIPEALAVGGSLLFTGDNTAATFAGDAVPGSLLDQYPSPNTWHAFTTTECADVTVSYCGTDAGWSNVWKLLATTCPADAVIQASSSDDTTCPNGNWTFSFTNLAPGTYYLPVPNVGFGQGGGAYSIEVSASVCANAPPANDLCGNVVAVALATGGTLTFNGDNTNATFAGDAVPGSLLDQYPFPNTWHAFTTTECADVTVSYCGTDAGWINIWRVLATDCPADAVIQASTSDQTTCPNGNWTFTFNNVAAGTYYLPVPNVGFGQSGGPYSIAVSAALCANAPPANDHCGDVAPVALAVGTSLTFTGNNTNATFDGDAEDGTILATYPFPNTWHAFTTTECADVTVSYCGTDAGWSNVWKLITTDCPAATIIDASSSNDTSCPNGNWTFTFNSLPAGTYYLPVPNVGFGQGGGAYTIAVSAAFCANVPPSNDHCEDVTAQNLATGSSLTFVGNNTNATYDGDAEDGTILATYPFPNTWHAFTTTECADVTVSYCGTDAGWSNVWKLLTTDCPAATIINASSSDDTTCPNGNWTFTFNNLPAGTYYLPVPNVGFGQGGGAYTITVSAALCANAPPANDLCGNVAPVDMVPGQTVTFTGDNTNATFAGDAEDGTVMATYPFPNTWHAINVADCIDLTVSYCATDSGWSNVWKLITTDCPANTIIYPSTSDSTTCSNHNWTFSFHVLAPGTYYLPVPNVGFGQGGGAYTIDVTAEHCIINQADAHVANPDWVLYPNPTDGQVTLSAPGLTGPATVEVVDMTGRSVYSGILALSAHGSQQLSLGGLAAPGHYLVVLTTPEGRMHKSMVIR